MTKIKLCAPKAYTVKPVYGSNHKPLRLGGPPAPGRPHRCAECGGPMSDPIPTFRGPVCSQTCAFYARQ